MHVVYFVYLVVWQTAVIYKNRTQYSKSDYEVNLRQKFTQKSVQQMIEIWPFSGTVAFLRT